MPPSHGGDRGFKSRRECHSYFMFIKALCQKEDQHLLVHHLDRTDHRDHVRKGSDDRDHEDRFHETVLQDLAQAELRLEPVPLVRQCELALRKDRDLSDKWVRRKETRDKSIPTI